jgi:uncharacterized LabA/DUF88 family protein
MGSWCARRPAGPPGGRDKPFEPSRRGIGGDPLLLSQSPDDRVMIFLDVANVSRAVEGHLAERHRIDWFRLAKHAAGARRLVGAYVFDRAPEGEVANPKRRFHDHLRYSGFRVVTRPNRIEDRGFQGEINVAIASELLSACYEDRLDVAVVISGDRNLAPALEQASRIGKIVEVACMADHLPAELRKAADRVTLEVKTCPAIAQLRLHGREIVPSFCQHCYFVSEAMAEPAGLTVRVEGGNGCCRQSFHRKETNIPPQDVSRIKEATC